VSTPEQTAAEETAQTPGQFRVEFLALAWKAAATLLTTAGFLGLVALTGGAITWLRFFVAELPADQAVAAFPRGELIVVGAAALTTFVVLGLVAVVAVYALDHGGRPTDGTRRGLVLLTTVEVLSRSSWPARRSTGTPACWWWLSGSTWCSARWRCC
jgi:hypothetical protein